MSKILNNREWHVEGKWYAPSEFLEENFSSVVKVEIVDRTSSAGDWSGYLVQKLGKYSYKIIRWWQTNCYPNSGFNLYTCDWYANCEEMPNSKTCIEAVFLD